MAMIFQGFVDRVMIYALVLVVARSNAWKLEFQGLKVTAKLGGAWMVGNSPCSCQKLWEMRFPQTTPIVGGQNSSSNLFLGSEPHVRALAWLGKKKGK
jgi:hypothetical protein